MAHRSIDVLIRGATIVDGSGNPWFRGDVALAAQRVLDVAPPGHLPPDSASEVIEAAGLVACPGFIDIQSHSIVPLMIDGRCVSKITQGVTTEIMGEGWTPAPSGGRIEDPFADTSTRLDTVEWQARLREWHRFGHWLETMEQRGVSPNIGSFLGGGTLREYARGMDMGPSTAHDREIMHRVMEEAMQDGAFGVSYALIYPPDTYAATDEIVDVCKVVSRYGGLYITHMRSESDRLFEGLDEALDIGRRADLPVEIYHLKAAGQGNWDKIPAVIETINEARAGGLDVTADMYPYVGSGTGLSSLLPTWIAAGGAFYKNLRDPEIRSRVRAETLNPSGDWDAFAQDAGPDGVMPIGFGRAENQQYVGKRLSEIASMRGQDWLDAAIDLLISEEQRIFTVYFSMSEDNVARQLRQPWIKISTDAGGVDPVWAAQDGPTHPRAYGTYPRVLGTYVREKRVLSLEEAVRKMSGAVAQRLGLQDRGMLKPGFWADVVLFDPETVGDRATFDDSHRLSVGIRDVWVNGTRVLARGEHTGATPGRVVRGRGAR
ncbi:MAG: amidohydrolase family protein [Chloroflexota bacterium]